MFVSNRTTEIQSVLPSDHWSHVRSKDNPADLISRGITFRDLKNCKLWWEGPEWLLRYTDYPSGEAQLVDLSPSEIKTIQMEEVSGSRIFLSTNEFNQTIQGLLDDQSALTKIERIIAWSFRFIVNARSIQSDREFGHLSTSEICKARRTLIKTIQKTHFAMELSNIETRGQINSNNKLLSLSPFLDEQGILRVGGRMQNVSIARDKKHPIVLPSNSKYTRLLFKREHIRLLHAGPQALLYSIRERYWPIRGKNIARKVVHNCVICFRNKPRAVSQLMGQLPADRVTPRRAFFTTGVDFTGPIITLINQGRGRKTNKSYTGCLRPPVPPF